MYFDDLNFVTVAHRFFSIESLRGFVPESNSMEFIRSGHIQLERKSDNRIIDLQAPAFYWLHRDQSYRYITFAREDRKKYTEHIYVDFLGRRSVRMLAALDELYPDGMFHPRNPEEISSIFFRILQLYRLSEKSNLPEMGFLLEKLIYEAYESARNPGPDSNDLYELEKIAEQLRSHPFSDYDFHKIAGSLHISNDHFRRIFREKHDMTPHAYLHLQRMLRAAELLKKNDMRIKEIAYSCNFKSLMDFSRTFKKYSGLSPRQFREKK